MTRILVDLLFATGRRGGMETYVRRIYERMGDLDPHVEWIGLASAELARAGAPWFPGELIDSGLTTVPPSGWALGELRAVAPAAARVRADAVHCPANLGPRRSPAPVVLTVHDVLPFVHPEWAGSPVSAVALRALGRWAVRGAACILTVSEASAADLRRQLRPRVPVEVIPLAGDDPDGAGSPVSREPGLLLVPGNRMPHKDPQTVLRALALLPADRRPRVVVTGSRPDDPLRPIVAELGLGDRVELVEWLAETELARLYATATAVVLPTRFEGFGLPVLEAMTRGCPVICSDLAVLREVGGDAAVYVEPGSAEGFAAAIARVVGDPDLRARLGDEGRARARAFDWMVTARRTLGTLVGVASGS